MKVDQIFTTPKFRTWITIHFKEKCNSWITIHFKEKCSRWITIHITPWNNIWHPLWNTVIYIFTLEIVSSTFQSPTTFKSRLDITCTTEAMLKTGRYKEKHKLICKSWLHAIWQKPLELTSQFQLTKSCSINNFHTSFIWYKKKYKKTHVKN